MLESIQVKNVALIDAAEAEFKDGLNILTGETGAGKSILLSSVQLALGAKADKSLIRAGAEFASVTLTFVPDESQKQKLAECDIACEEDILILQRRVYPGKSVCKINGETVLLKQMQTVAELLIDIHGQREHQAILNASIQEKMLDDFCAEDISDDLEKLSAYYREVKEHEKLLEEVCCTDGSNERELDFAKFELDEITKADLKPGEDIQLQEQFDRLSNAKKIEESVGTTKEILMGSHGGVLSGISEALHSLSVASDLDEELASAYSQLSDAEVVIQDCGHTLDRYLDRFMSEASDLQAVTERLNLINHLKDKYGNDIESILQYAERLADKIEKIENSEQYIQKLEAELKEAKENYYEVAKIVHNQREKGAKALSEDMKQALSDLNFEQCEFVVACTYCDSIMRKNGCTNVKFMISLNKGEALKELSNVASGGELSRIMLAIKTVFADKDQMGTLVFDEIDAGISGKTAWKVSEKLAVLRKRHQVICITHLPQIAAMADVHFCIKKSSDHERTNTTVTELNEEESVAEIGRLLGTDQLTDAVIQNAVEMKNLARKTKQY